jgi:hypothetical protein
MLDSIEVTDSRQGKVARFLYRNWFNNKCGWKHLLHLEGAEGSASGLVTYLVCVRTSDVRGAGATFVPVNVTPKLLQCAAR